MEEKKKLNHVANVYVASSWRNTHQPRVVRALRADGHSVYDFMDSEGFSWKEVDPDWQLWTPRAYMTGLEHQVAIRGFNRDMEALRACSTCVYVMTCGVSASIEMGWACGAGKRVFVYITELREPDLMVKMADGITDDLFILRAMVKGESK